MRVFFYGLFMDEALLRELGAAPRDAVVGFVDGHALRIGRRATMVPAEGERAYGVAMTITAAEAAALYAEESVADYRPEPVTFTPRNGETEPATTYVLPDGPDAGTNREYAAKLAAVARRLGLPEGYCEGISKLR